MSKRRMWIIIGLMCTAMLGIAVLQVVWLRWQVALDNQKFDDKVFEALGEVKQKLEEDASSTAFDIYRRSGKPLFSKEEGDNIKRYFGRNKETFAGGLRNYEISSLPYLLDPQSKLDNLNLSKLETYLKNALDAKGLQTTYEYGVYSNELEALTSINGNYVATVLAGQSSDQGTDQENTLLSSNYKIELFDTTEEQVGSLLLKFPAKQRFILSSILLPLLSSLLFTGLIAFCFIYTMIVIFRQKQVSEMKTDFINNMTHEFKTPIATISLASDSILSPSIISNEDKIRRFLGIIKQENKRMLNQVEDVLQMARIDKKEFKLTLENVNIHQLILDAVENTKLKIESKNGAIETVLKAGNAIVEADENHIANIINNLLDNAEKYTPETPRIIVSTKNISKGIQVSVTDNGIGMSKESQKHIFDKFYRVHTGNLHDVKGFGLGLSYVKALVDAHQGNVSVKSELGKGSTFSFVIPLKQSDLS